MKAIGTTQWWVAFDGGQENIPHPLYYAGDANGNVTDLLNNNGILAARYEYDPYGNTIAQSGDLAETNPFRFSSKYWDAGVGVYYYGYRFYSPGMGRWINRDPIGEEGGENLYGFVFNDPINLIDSLGQEYWGRHEGCCGGQRFDDRQQCCENDTPVDKEPIWICRRKLGGPDSWIPKIGPLSHTFIVCEDPTANPGTDQKFGKQPGDKGIEGGFRGPGCIEEEPYSDFSDCKERKVCPAEKSRMCQEGPTEDSYFMFSPSRNCHGWGNRRSR
ncbi:MAG: RHS repeat-associated core domain-containing protein [Kiritimatiellae bacterium]|nr:RHS repeat-associated core domain-containing protein [Kiritimatiellia bacterium]